MSTRTKRARWLAPPGWSLRRGGVAALQLGAALALLAGGARAGAALGGVQGDSDEPHATGFATILEADVRAHIEVLAAPGLQGRDTPSIGLDLAAAYVAERFERAGLRPLEGSAGFRSEYEFRSPYPMFEPDPAECSLTYTDAEGTSQSLTYSSDFVPLPLASGQAEGPLVFLGFGIKTKGYNDLQGKSVKGSIAMIFEGEPEHPKKFDGPEFTESSDIYAKLEQLDSAGVAGVLLIRRPAPSATQEGESEATGDGEASEARVPFRFTWAVWNETNPGPLRTRQVQPPVLEIDVAAASRILGEDVLALLAELDATAKPVRRDVSERQVVLSAKSKRAESLRAPNVIGLVPGSDPELAGEYVIVGAHLDHIGVGYRTRIGYGADDNASGSAALLEIAEALGAAPPRRSVLLCAFSGEEDGLLGSAYFANNLPMKPESVVAMLNLDQIARGPRDVVAILGVKQNPKLEAVLKRAQDLAETGVKKYTTNKAQHLWQRSDHYSFHRVGVPTLFFFEDPKGEQTNPDYHTWRDTIDLVDFDKITRTTKLAYNTTWLLATDDQRPPPPKR